MTTDALVLILGTADWSQPIATNQHYMSRELSVGSPVLFVESMGLRRPRLSRRDVNRALARLRRFRRSSASQLDRELPMNLEVVSPILVPFHGGIFERLNRLLLNRGVKKWVNHTGARVLWTYSPVTYGLERHADATIYHCVDLLREVAGISSRLIDEAEDHLARSDVMAIGSSEVVVAHLREQGFVDPRLWQNVADVEAIENVRSEVTRVKSAVFAGNLSGTKLDFPLLRAILDAGVQLHLAGPLVEGGGNSAGDIAALVNAGAVYHGMLSMEDLASLYQSATVGLIPYQLNSYTRGVSPLKTYEYLAAGLYVVSSPLPSMDSREGDVCVSPNSDEFLRAVVEQVEVLPSLEVCERRRVVAREHSWQTRGQEARDVLAGVTHER